MDGLNNLENWPNKVKVMQKNWIGKSFGCEIDFKIKGNLPVNEIKCFTTRPHTLFGFSFLAVSVDHPISKYFVNDPEFEKFKNECQKTGTTEESIALGEKIGFHRILAIVIGFIVQKMIVLDGVGHGIPKDIIVVNHLSTRHQ